MVAQGHMAHPQWVVMEHQRAKSRHQIDHSVDGRATQGLGQGGDTGVDGGVDDGAELNHHGAVAGGQELRHRESVGHSAAAGDSVMDLPLA